MDKSRSRRGEMATLPLLQIVLRSTHKMINSGSRPKTRDFELEDDMSGCHLMLQDDWMNSLFMV